MLLSKPIQRTRINGLTGIKDIDLLIIQNLSDSEIENVEKCIVLKDEPCFWKSLLVTNHSVTIKCDKKDISWKKVYLEHTKFFEYFNLTLVIALLKDYDQNFALYYLLYMKKKIKYQGFFPLLEQCLDLLEDFNVLNLRKHLLNHLQISLEIQRKYLEISYPFSLKFGKEMCSSTNLLSFLYTRIYKKDNIFSYEKIIDPEGILNIRFKCDVIFS